LLLLQQALAAALNLQCVSLWRRRRRRRRRGQEEGEGGRKEPREV